MRDKLYPFERSTSNITEPLSPGFCRSFSMGVVHKLIDKSTSESKVQLLISDDISVFVTGIADSVWATVAQAV
jgi:hypothetical protein